MEETQRLKPPPWVFLVGLLFFLSPLIPSTSAPVPGSPLTSDEYEVFFSALRPEQKASTMCQLRRNQGCQSPKIKQLDKDENHGQIPEGPICTDLSENRRFETFCMFAQFRCLDQKFYAKRIECPILAPDETTSIPTETPHTPDPWQTASHHTKHPVPVSQPLREKPLHSSIDTFLRYSFAVSGQEPELRKGFPDASSTKEGLQGSVHLEHPAHSKVWLVTASGVTVGIKEAEKIAGHHLQQNGHHPMGTAAFTLESSLNEESTEIPEGGRQEETTRKKSKGRLLDLEKDDALLILCFAVLEDICISSGVIKAWKRVENNMLGYGDLVCDSLGRRHMDLCPTCAFCSLKMEQCQQATDLRRVQCDEDGSYTTYINPKISTQNQEVGTKVASPVAENAVTDAFGGLRADRWCGRLATHGCTDTCVELWLETEYSFFQHGDYPDKICDSERVEHPYYCAFKSHQCLQNSLDGRKVLRRGCLKSEAYRVLSKEEGKEEVALWSQKFLNSTEG